MGNNRIASIDDLRIIAPLVEHTHIQIQHVGQIDRALGGSLVRADRHHVVAVDLQILEVAQKPFDKLVCGANRFKAIQRDGILHPWIMGVKSNDIVYAHPHQFLKRQGAVQGFPAASLVLAAFIQERHDHVKTAGLSADSGDDTLQILIMIVRGHVILMSCQRVSQAVIADVYHQIDIHSPDRVIDNAFGFAGAKTGDLCVY